MAPSLMERLHGGRWQQRRPCGKDETEGLGLGFISSGSGLWFLLVIPGIIFQWIEDPSMWFETFWATKSWKQQETPGPAQNPLGGHDRIFGGPFHDPGKPGYSSTTENNEATQAAGRYIYICPIL